MRQNVSAATLTVLCSLFVGAQLTDANDRPWIRHTIDDSSRGADGVRLADVDGDGLLDVVTGWEEGGVVRICLHPGDGAVGEPWPSVTVGEAKSPEDAVSVDLDGDGAPDVVSCCEGKTRTVYIHWAPVDRNRYWEKSAWTTEAIPTTANQQPWMFCLPEKEHRPALIVGSKGGGATISRLVATGDPREGDNWSMRELCEAGWIMSLRSVDMDGDGDRDVLFSDRKGPTRGVAWLERPADPDAEAWPKHVVGGTGEEVMFLDVGDLLGDGRPEVVVATRSAGVVVLRRRETLQDWSESMIPMPPNCGTGKGVRIADVDEDGRADLFVSCENSGGKHGLFWLSRRTKDGNGEWEFHPISGDQEGVKFDRLEALDLDGDGDLDVMTCEERDNLGVVWYENPVR